jgi:predicted tellurium resistance membrane protein TerC
MDWITSPEAWIALLTLTVLEIVLGIDNIVFISILAGRLPSASQARARTLGLALAMGMRILLLLSIAWVMGLTKPLFSVFSHEISGRDLILMTGGLFLLWKATREIHERLEGPVHQRTERPAAPTLAGVLVQIALLDLVFSLDSVITAVGMAEHIPVMVAAIIIAVGFMMFTAGAVSRFVEQHPTVKMLALSFLILIGVALVAESLHRHIPKGYIYFAMAFSVGVEVLNLRARRLSQPVHLHSPTVTPASAGPQASEARP